jgi:hypothetical protein
MKHPITLGEKYGPAMEVKTQAEADRYFKECVKHNLEARRMRGEPEDLEKAEQTERSNLGYFAGYYSRETRERVERLFRCSHPVFGSLAKNGAPTPAQAFAAGMARGVTQ